jgi:hypothetical protein
MVTTSSVDSNPRGAKQLSNNGDAGDQLVAVGKAIRELLSFRIVIVAIDTTSRATASIASFDKWTALVLREGYSANALKPAELELLSGTSRRLMVMLSALN